VASQDAAGLIVRDMCMALRCREARKRITINLQTFDNDHIREKRAD